MENIELCAGEVLLGDQIAVGDGMLFDVVGVALVGGKVTLSIKSDYSVAFRGIHDVEVDCLTRVHVLREAGVSVS